MSPTAAVETPGAGRRWIDRTAGAIGRIARVPQLLVACDYDGTLAPIVEDPTPAVPLPEAVAAVRALAALPQTTVAVISGRALRDLAALSRLPGEVHLVGSHGSEFDVGFVERLAAGAARGCAPGCAASCASSPPTSPASGWSASPPAWPCTPAASTARSPSEVDRGGPQRAGDLARHLRHHRQGGHRAVGGRHRQGRRGGLSCAPSCRPARSLFLGDDVTDENAFAKLHGPDIGIKIGRRRDPGRLPGRRADRGRAACWPAAARRGGTGSTASARCRSSATRCSPTGDGGAAHPGRQGDLAVPSAAGLGGDLRGPARRRPGRALLRHRPSAGPPARPALPARHDDGRDPLVRADGDRLARTGRRRHAETAPPCVGYSTLVRVLSGTPGPARVRAAAGVRPGADQAAAARRRAARARLQRADRALRPRRRVGRLRATAATTPREPWSISPRPAARVTLELRFGSHNVDPHPDSDRGPAGAGRAAVARLGGRARAARSRQGRGRPQRADPARPRATSRPASILAAATMSLPEELGGVRNWDYRYCWLRDAAMTARVLVDLGSLDRGRGAPALGRRMRRAHGRPPGAAASALHGRGARARPRGGDRHAARLRRLAAGADRQRRQPPDPARRLRPDRRSRRGRRRPRAARYATSTGASSRRWCRPSGAAGTSPTTASGRRGCRPATTSTPR